MKKDADEARLPRKIGLNWFMPALVKRSVVSSAGGMTGFAGQNVCCFGTRVNTRFRIAPFLTLLSKI